jgi:muconolactone D-isomerase
MKFLVIWQMELSLLSPEMARAVGSMPEYGERLQREGKVLSRYHIVGSHGGAWIYDVDSHEEFERLLGRTPVFNFARYTVHALADMGSPIDGLRDTGDGGSQGGGNVR